MSKDYSNISNYEMIKTLGEGTFGKVKLAIFKRTNEEFAIKIMNKYQIKIKMINSEFREIEIVSKLDHINIAKVFQIIEDVDYYYIVMEYCEGGELFDYIMSKRKLDELEASLFFYQLINGVEYIHCQKISHRDLKLENLLLTKGKLIKIIDFGLSNEFDGTNLLKTKCGSPSYASPEIVRGEEYDGFKVDIWCCGIILYAMVCGYLPFDGEDEGNDVLLNKIVLCNPEMPEYLGKDVKILIKSMLTSDPKDRISIEGIKKSNFYFKGKQVCDLSFDCLLTEYYSNKKEILTKENKNDFYKNEPQSLGNNNLSDKRKNFKDIEYNNESKHYIDTYGNDIREVQKRKMNIVGKNNIFNVSKKNHKINFNYSYKFGKNGENLKKNKKIEVADKNIHKILKSNDNNNMIYNNSLNNENVNKNEVNKQNKFNINKTRLMRLIDQKNNNIFLITNSSPKRKNDLYFNRRTNYQARDKTISYNKNGIYQIINRNNALKPMNTKKEAPLHYRDRLINQNNIIHNNYTPMRNNIVSVTKTIKQTPDHPSKLELNNFKTNINTKYINTSINKTIFNSLNANKTRNRKAIYLSIDKSRYKNNNFNYMNNSDNRNKTNISKILEKNNAENNNTQLSTVNRLNNKDKAKLKNKLLIKEDLQEIKAKIEKIFPVSCIKNNEEVDKINNMKLNGKKVNILPFIRFNKVS